MKAGVLDEREKNLQGSQVGKKYIVGHYSTGNHLLRVTENECTVLMTNEDGYLLGEFARILNVESKGVVNNYNLGVEPSRWEYRTVTMLASGGLPLSRVLNEYARQGWEYCDSRKESKQDGTCRVILRRSWKPRQPLTADEVYEKVKRINAELGGEVVNE